MSNYEASDSEERRSLVAAGSREPEPRSESAGCGSSAACDPRRALHRYIVLVFICFLSFGSYYVYDNPAALMDVMKSELQMNTVQFTTLYSLYSWPNVILCFFGGFLIDRVFGVRWGAVIFCILVAVGQLVFAIGAFVDTYWLMCVGRFIFGLGGESLGVAQNTYTVNWFSGHELNMVFGLQLSFARVGSTVNMNTMHHIYDSITRSFHNMAGYKRIGLSLLIGGAFCLLSLFCSLVMFYFDRRAKRILHEEEAKSGEKIRFSDIKDFGLRFWLLCVICVAYYVAVFPFISIALVFFENKYQLDAGVANTVNSVVFIISAVGSPVCGFGIDMIGRNVAWLLVGVIVTLACHGMLAFTFWSPFVPMIIMGLSFSVVASALWPMVAIVIPKHQIATAYGIMQSVQNLGLAVVAIMNGAIVDSKGYFILEISMLLWLCVALIATVALYIFDANTDGLLNMSSTKRKNLAEKQIVQIGSGDETDES